MATQPNLFDVPELPPFVRGSDTSKAAAESMIGSTATLRSAILGHIESAGKDGRTCWECELNLAMRHQTCSARIRELAQLSLIVDSGRRRKTESNRTATVWLAKGVDG
jgi:hypothetical protein